MFAFQKTRLQAKLTLLYVLMSILPILMISTLSYQVYNRNIVREMYALVNQYAHQHGQTIGERLSGQKNILYEMVTSRELLEQVDVLNRTRGEGDVDVLISKSSLISTFQTYSWTSSYISGIVFVSNTGDYASYSKQYNIEPFMTWSDPGVRRELYDAVKDAQQVVLLPTRNLSMPGSTPSYAVLIGYPMRNLHTREIKGVLLLALSEDILKSYSDSAATGIVTVVTASNGAVLSGDDPAYLTQPIDRLRAEQFGAVTRIREQVTPIAGTDWQIVNIVDESVYLRDIGAFAKLVGVFTVCISLVFFVIVYLISSRYTKSISRITEGIVTYADGAMDVNVEIDDKDDLYVIAHQFNRMTRRVNSLVVDLEQQTEAVRRAVTGQKKAEMKALEAQINPHFLYNTLDSINWMAIENDQIEISNMLGNLGSMLRYSISNIDVVVTMSAEVEWLKKYVFLQRERFSGSFDLTCRATGEALDFPVFKLLFQPIVENCILHGFEDTKSGGMITLDAHVDSAGRLVVRIGDNGCGMAPEQLQVIRALIASPDPLNGESIGVSNTVNRLGLYYHGQASISVESETGRGTAFTLTMPNIEWGAAHGNSGGEP